MQVYSTMQLYVKAPNHIAEIVWTRALEVKEGIFHTSKEKEPVLDTCLRHLSWPRLCVYVPLYSYNTTGNTG